MENRTGLNKLRSHLFDAIERVKSINDPNTSENEKMSIEQAEVICDISAEIIDTYKVEVQAMSLLVKAENPNRIESMIQNNGMLRLDK